MTMQESEVKDHEGLGIECNSSLTSGGQRIDGATLSLVDIDALKHLIGPAQHEKRSRSCNRTKDQFLATLSHELRTPLPRC